jgi:cytochrome c551/c552
MTKDGLALLTPPSNLKYISLVPYQESVIIKNSASINGKEIFQKMGCIGCHQMDAIGSNATVGPDLSHIGDRLSHSELYEAIATPNMTISKFCPNGPCVPSIMPASYLSMMKKEELDALLDFLSQQRQ